MRRQHIIDKIRQAFASTAPGAEVILYGSEARGEATPDSDIDLLVLLNREKVSYADEEHIVAPLYDIELSTGVLVSCRILPKHEWENRPFMTPFYNNVMRDGIRL